MNREEIREEIDDIDALMVDLFVRRMQEVRNMASYKKKNNLPVRDATREAEKLRDVTRLAPEALRDYVKRLYEEIFALSREYQENLMRDL